MPKGNLIAEYSVKSTSATYQPGPAGSTVVQVNFEGTATGGLGAVAGTAAFVGGKSGTFSWIGGSYAENGDQVVSNATGAYESIGLHRWSTIANVTFSDGRVALSEGELDFPSRTWTGKLYAPG